MHGACIVSLLPLLLQCLSWDKWYFSALLYIQGFVLISQHCSVARGMAGVRFLGIFVVEGSKIRCLCHSLESES